MSFYFTSSTTNDKNSISSNNNCSLSNRLGLRKSFNNILNRNNNNNNNSNNNHTSIVSGSGKAGICTVGGNPSGFFNKRNKLNYKSNNSIVNSMMISVPNNGQTAAINSSSVYYNNNNINNNNSINSNSSPIAFNLKSNNHNNNNSNNNHSLFTSTLTSSMMPSVASRLKKNIARTKEKIMQGMGKSDRTSDENFDVYVENFERQHAQASKLTKELNKYLNCLRETQKSSKAFYDTLKETYETGWPNSSEFTEHVQIMELKWMDYLNKLTNDVQSPLIAYLNEFPELKKKIEKRGNRLLDYDDARHTLENIQNKTNKKNSSINSSSSSAVSNNNNNNFSSSSSSSSSTANNQLNSAHSSSTTDQLTKLTKLKIDLEDKQHIYEEINQTLCMALPVLFENRIKFYASLFQTFFHTETIFHSDCIEVKSKLDDICENLSINSAQQQLPQHQQEENLTPERNENATTKSSSSSSSSSRLSTSSNSCSKQQDSNLATNIQNNDRTSERSLGGLYPDLSDHNSPYTTQTANIRNIDSSDNLNGSVIQEDAINEVLSNTAISATDNSFQNGTVNSSSARLLYKVKATYPYEAKEVDELTFTKDDVIQVVDGTESEKEDLDDGWLIGIHENTNKRGLFPENFTKKI